MENRIATLTMRHLVIDNNRKIGLEYKNNPAIQALIDTFKDVVWSDKFKMNYINNTTSNINRIFLIFRGIAWVNGKYFFKDSPININVPEPDYSYIKNKKSKRKRKCPSEYIDKLQVLRYSKNTVNTYVSMFEEFINYYEEKDLLNINENDIRAFLLSLVNRNVSHSYQNQSINAVKFYYEIVLGLPNRHYYIERPKKQEKLPVILSIDEVQRLLRTVKNLKHKAILITIYSAGLRISELLELKISDIQSDRMLIMVRNTKGNKDRTTLLGRKSLEILREYYKQYKPKNYLFEAPSGNKYSATSVRKVFKRALINAKINKMATVHTLRHSFATHLLEKGTNLRYIQTLLGHSSPKTTEIYTRVSTVDIEQIKNPIDNLDL